MTRTAKKPTIDGQTQCETSPVVGPSASTGAETMAESPASPPSATSGPSENRWAGRRGANRKPRPASDFKSQPVADEPVGDPIAGAIGKLDALDADRQAAARQLEHEHAEQFAKYVAILHRRESPLPTDAAELAAIAVHLGFDRQRLENDVAVVQSAAAYRESVGQRQAAMDELLVARGEIKELETQLEAAQLRVRKLSGRVSWIQSAGYELAKLVRNYPQLLLAGAGPSADPSEPSNPAEHEVAEFATAAGSEAHPASVQ